MKRTHVVLGTIAVIALTAATALAAKWVSYQSDKFGFKMSIPADMKHVDKDFGGGWGGFAGELGVVKLLGIARLDTTIKPADMEKFAVTISGIPAKSWTLVDQGKGQNGWTWYKTWQATDGKGLVYGIEGQGPKGSYLIFLVTTAADFKANNADYLTWYGSLTVF